MPRSIAAITFVLLALSAAPFNQHAIPTADAGAPTVLPDAPNCPVFPENNVWNADISRLPVAANSAAMIQSIGPATGLHPDFGSYLGYGIPYNVVSGNQVKVPVTFDYASESDPGPYPIPADPKVEGGSDRHILIVDKDRCVLYELYDARQNGGAWSAGSGAIWKLRSNALRPDSWTSADAAGLPILPGLVRYDEIAAGSINHALRFTAAHTAKTHIYPARHDAGVNNPGYPPMGLRVRLKASVDISHFSPRVQVLLGALKKYGMILADNGSNWYISGMSDRRFNDDEFHTINQITGADFEVVDTSGLINGPDNGGSAQPSADATAAEPTPTTTHQPSVERATAGVQHVVVLTPVADTSVRDGAYATTHYGAAGSCSPRGRPRQDICATSTCASTSRVSPAP